MPYINVHVDADDVLSELSTDELVKELERRRHTFDAGVPELMLKMHHELNIGNDDRALVLARRVAEVSTGRMVLGPRRIH